MTKKPEMLLFQKLKLKHMENKILPSFDDIKRFNRDYAPRLRQGFEKGDFTFDELEKFLEGKKFQTNWLISEDPKNFSDKGK